MRPAEGERAIFGFKEKYIALFILLTLMAVRVFFEDVTALLLRKVRAE